MNSILLLVLKIFQNQSASNPLCGLWAITVQTAASLASKMLRAGWSPQLHLPALKIRMQGGTRGFQQTGDFFCCKPSCRAKPQFCNSKCLWDSIWRVTEKQCVKQLSLFQCRSIQQAVIWILELQFSYWVLQVDFFKHSIGILCFYFLRYSTCQDG